MSENLELPLKIHQETFTDEPKEINDVNIHDLAINIGDNVKDINSLHLVEAIAILLHSLEDIIKLNDHGDLLQQFRRQQLKKRNIDLDHHRQQSITIDSSSSEDSTTDIRKPTPPNSPPAKVLKVDNDFALKERTPDSLIEEHDLITIEQLLQSTNIDDINTIDFDDITEEYQYYQNMKIVEQNQHVIKNFNLIQPPDLSIEQFLNRIKTYSPSTSVSCYIHATLLIFKLSVLHDVLPLTLCNVHRIILASIRCSTKKLEDIYQKQKTFATVGGVTLKDLYRIEVGFLFLCNFRLVVGEDSLNNYLKEFTDLRDFVKRNIDDVK
ncbi:hypothetical protein CLIB1444_01S20538 [[Candida] jaroonii]|uniref:Uncharacterized protein n=1 Tax=[Candida] jaroonii TaxID=467808 RepID=A0ACA9Y2Q5_9ASCO|nr:hypothetical protein CLIB1444_01S20538 [[Candida] jaroonii]